MRSEKQKLANYTELVHAGEGVTIEKGVISASGGSGGGGESGNTTLIVTGEYDSSTQITTLDKTVNEIMNALNSGTLVLFVHEYTNDDPYSMATPIFQVSYESDTYWVYIYNPLVSSETGYVTFFADTLDSYPVDNE